MWVEMKTYCKPSAVNIVILLVRMWVEISLLSDTRCLLPSSSSWGCELKCYLCAKEEGNWKSSSSWGCELKWSRRGKSQMLLRHPPREDVSWNEYEKFKMLHEVMSSSSWGCELKYLNGEANTELSASSSSWGCELKCEYTGEPTACRTSSSSWGCELKYLSTDPI